MPNKQFFLSFENFEKGLVVLYVRDLPVVSAVQVLQVCYQPLLLGKQVELMDKLALARPRVARQGDEAQGGQDGGQFPHRICHQPVVVEVQDFQRGQR